VSGNGVPSARVAVAGAAEAEVGAGEAVDELALGVEVPDEVHPMSSTDEARTRTFAGV
jgi:hypothetical protein